MVEFKNVLITGVTGSAGSYLAEQLRADMPEVAVHGFARKLVTPPAGVTLHQVDLADVASVIRGISAIGPLDVVFHLASNADVRGSWDMPAAVISNNVACTVNLFEALRTLSLRPLVKVCSTSEVYGQVPAELVPIKEDAPLHPANPYAVSKTTQDLIAVVYQQAYHIPTVRTRAFGYINPRRENLFASAFARQVARVERGLQPTLRHGNLESVRTLLDVRDVMRAYIAAAQRGKIGEAYNIGSTEPVKVGDVLKLLVEQARCEIPCETDPALIRPVDVTLQIPDCGKFVADTGWQPIHPLKDALAQLLDYWRRRVANVERD